MSCTNLNQKSRPHCLFMDIYSIERSNIEREGCYKVILTQIGFKICFYVKGVSSKLDDPYSIDIKFLSSSIHGHSSAFEGSGSQSGRSSSSSPKCDSHGATFVLIASQKGGATRKRTKILL